jgi:drug/metabolite transporter (DMT)-like permease
LPFKNTKILLLTGFTVFIVIFGGFWLSLVSLKFIGASISTILNFTTPLFILPLAAVFLKQKTTLLETIGSLLAITGIALIFSSPG